MSTDPAVLLALADRCEREEPSSPLNVAICFAIFGDDKSKWPTPPLLRQFTTSLDAAVTLVPERWDTIVAVMLTTRDPAAARVFKGAMYPSFNGEAKTEAMARCAAALRARASLLDEGAEK